jgi:hypothetical protein
LIYLRYFDLDGLKPKLRQLWELSGLVCSRAT